MDTENLTGENLELIYYIDALAKIFCSGKHWGGGVKYLGIQRSAMEKNGQNWPQQSKLF